MGQERSELENSAPIDAQPVASGKSPSSDTEEIRDDITRTRSAMTDTIDEISDRLSPHHLLQQAKQSVQDSASRKVKDMMHSATSMVDQVSSEAQSSLETTLDQVRANPVPAASAVALAGLAWWMTRRRFGSSSAPVISLPMSLAIGGLGYLLVRRLAEQTQGSGPDVAGYARTLTTDAEESISQYGNQLGQAAQGAARSARGAMQSAETRAAESWRSAKSGISQTLGDQPLAIGAVAMAAGLAVGLALPNTEAENRTTGRSRQALVDKASAMTSEIKSQVEDRVRSVAQSVVDGVKEGIGGPESAPS